MEVDQERGKYLLLSAMKLSADDEARMTAKLKRWQSSRRNVLVTVVSTTAIILVALAYLAKTYKPLPSNFLSNV
jgi:hypothetical protein